MKKGVQDINFNGIKQRIRENLSRVSFE